MLKHVWPRGTTTELQTVLGALNSAVLFIGMNNSGTVQPIVAVERTVFYRERAAGMYSPIPYAIAQVSFTRDLYQLSLQATVVSKHNNTCSQMVTEIPYVFFQSVFYAIIVYPMMGFQLTAAKFFWFLFISFFTFLYFTYYGMMTVAITPNLQIASIFGSAFYGIFNLFSGLHLLTRPFNLLHKHVWRWDTKEIIRYIWNLPC